MYLYVCIGIGIGYLLRAAWSFGVSALTHVRRQGPPHPFRSYRQLRFKSIRVTPSFPVTFKLRFQRAKISSRFPQPGKYWPPGTEAGSRQKLSTHKNTKTPGDRPRQHPRKRRRRRRRSDASDLRRRNVTEINRTPPPPEDESADGSLPPSHYQGRESQNLPARYESGQERGSKGVGRATRAPAGTEIREGTRERANEGATLRYGELWSRTDATRVPSFVRAGLFAATEAKDDPPLADSRAGSRSLRRRGTPAAPGHRDRGAGPEPSKILGNLVIYYSFFHNTRAVVPGHPPPFHRGLAFALRSPRAKPKPPSLSLPPSFTFASLSELEISLRRLRVSSQRGERQRETKPRATESEREPNRKRWRAEHFSPGVWAPRRSSRSRTTRRGS